MITAEQYWHVRQSRYFLANPSKIRFLMRDGNVTQITDANICQPGAVFAKGSQMCGPKADAVRAERRAFARTGGTVVRDADYLEISISGRKLGAVQVRPKSMRCGGVGHQFSFLAIVSLNKNGQ